MTRNRRLLGNLPEQVLPWLVLAVLLFYTYAKFFEHPYSGFRPNADGFVRYIFVEQTTQPALALDDRIIRMGTLRWSDFKSDYRKRLFENVQTNEIVPLTVQRAGQEIVIPWRYPGPNRGEILDLLISEGWLVYVFWLVGTATILALRPKDEIWLLMIGFNYLTAIWLVVGSGVSMYHIWSSPLILRVSIWFCVPIYLHLHWSFPRRLARLSGPIVIIGYVVASILSALEWFQLLPQSLYLTGFLLAVTGSLLLLFAHFVFQPEARNDLRLLILVGLLAFLPAIAVGIASAFIAIPALAGAGLLGLPLIPIAYVYGVYRRQLGGLEIRLNRIISIYLFLIMMGVIALPLIVVTAIRTSSPGSTIIIAIIMGAIVAIVTILWFPSFQAFVDRWLLGIRLPPKRLLETYSARITTSDLLSDLVRVLELEIMPSLLIRQFVFLRSDNGTLKVLSKLGVDEEQIPKGQDMPTLLTQPGLYRSPDLAGSYQPYSWIRLILPLKLGDETNGFWLFGRRDPDDIYSQLEIPILQSLASQTAIALSNILQTERLKLMYEGNIDRYEQEKLRLSRDLHDSVMNEMAALLMREDAPVFSPEFQQAFEALTEQLREIVTELRPPALTFGLKPALEDMAEGLSERNREKIKVVVYIQSGEECRYPDNVENHLYRIVQEACGNALKYAHAKTIRTTGKLSRQKIELTVEDDGVGFDAESNPNLDDTHASKHYGLTGMHERASLIGADVNIDAKPGQGTRIQVIWESKESI
jgi:signal transduction histidine kinase